MSDSLIEQLNQLWSELTKSGKRPCYIICQNARHVRVAKKRRGRKFVFKESFIDAYRRAVREA